MKFFSKLSVSNLEQKILIDSYSIEIFCTSSRLRTVRIVTPLQQSDLEGISLIYLLNKADAKAGGKELTHSNSQIIDCFIDMWIADGNQILLSHKEKGKITGCLCDCIGKQVYEVSSSSLTEVLLSLEDYLQSIKYKDIAF